MDVTFCFEGFALALPRTLSWFNLHRCAAQIMGGSAAPILSAHHHSASERRWRLWPNGKRQTANGNSDKSQRKYSYRHLI
jgi:hypothetical protein